MAYSKLLTQYIEELTTDELEVVQNTLEHYSLIPKAPMLLKESIIEMTSVLVRFEKNKGSSETLTMYKRWLDSMKMSLAFINDIAKIATENIMLKDMSDMNYKLYKGVQNKLAKYEMLEQLIISDKLEKDIEIVKKKISENGR